VGYDHRPGDHAPQAAPGRVTCKIEINGKAISTATASGGYNIASCETSQDPLSGKWTDTNGG
jgi:hypothetical protein